MQSKLLENSYRGAKAQRHKVLQNAKLNKGKSQAEARITEFEIT
jgi:hypothetical protein